MKKQINRIISVLLTFIMCFGLFPISEMTAFAAATEEVYMVQLPRGGDPNQTGWGHPAMTYANGWHTVSSDHTTAKAIGDYESSTVYCIEPGVPLNSGDTLNKKGENFWEDYPDGLNNVLSPAQVKQFIGRIFVYGWTGKNNLDWKSSNATHADQMGELLATQSLVWETIVGDRNQDFNWVKAPSGKDNIIDMLSSGHPLKSQIMSHYNRIAASVKNHVNLPSFLFGNTAGAQTHELKWDGSKYTVTLTDSHNLLGNFDFFSSSVSGISFSVSGNKLTISTSTPPSGNVDITASKKSSYRKATVVWTDYTMSNKTSGQIQDLVSYAEDVSDPVKGYVKVKVAVGHVKLVKTSEDGVVANILFNISGNGINKNVTTGANGEILVENLQAGTYTITEQSIDRYKPQETKQVTVIGGQTTTVTFSNVLKRGSLEVIKSSEDNLNEGHKFHLYGTSLSGLKVDEYAVTDKNGKAVFKDVLISGSTSYTLEEVDTAIRYVVPDKQDVIIQWNEVTHKSVTNILKKFRVEVKKADSEFTVPQGNSKLSGAIYGLYKGGVLVNTYTTSDKDGTGYFMTDYYVCDTDWTLKEIKPSEGFLLDPTVYKVGASPGLFTAERNTVNNNVYEDVKKGRILIVKHTDDGSTKIETPEIGATFEAYLTSAGSYQKSKATERDILIVDNDGFAKSNKALPYGWYTVHQLSGWEGKEKIPDFQVYVSEHDKTYTYIINNATFESKLKIEKRDAETGKLIASDGIGFQIIKPDGKLLVQTVYYPTPTDISEFFTNSEGWLMLPYPLEYGKGYQLVETTAVPPYVRNKEPVYFDITGDHPGTMITVTMYNTPQKGKFTISKTGEIFSTVEEKNGLYTPVYKIGGLPDTKYDIYADEDIYVNYDLKNRGSV